MKTVNLLFSGGRTSAYLVEKSLELRAKWDLPINFIITFANTSKEHVKTLEFVDKCDKRWKKLYGHSVVWLEAVVHHDSRTSSTHKITSFESCKKNGEVFEEVVKKYGLPNNNFLHCTRELKENPIMSYMESLGHRKGFTRNGVFHRASYETWVGIRIDEPKRLGGRKNGMQFKVHPLAGDSDSEFDLTVDKQDVFDFWGEMPFDLDLPEHLGNCVDCHKKSFNKLFKVARDMGEKEFYHSAYLDSQYSEVKAQEIDGRIIPRKRFRGYTDTKQLIQMFRDSEFNPANHDDESGSCSESCNGFDDNEPLSISEMKFLDLTGIEEQQI